MLKFKEIKIKNFMSFGNKVSSFQLERNTSCLILGNNEDVGEQGESRNGAGKSTLFNAIIFCLFGKGIDKLKADEYINITNDKGLVVELSLEYRGENYRIVRGRKPNILEFYKGDESYTLDAMKNTDELITNTLNIDYDIFMMVYFLSPHKESFMSMSGADQRSMIEKMLNLNVLVNRAETLKLMRNELEVDARMIQKEIEYVDMHNDKVNINIDRLTEKQENFEKERKENLEKFNKRLEEYSTIDIEKCNTALKYLEDINKYIDDYENTLKVCEQALSDKNNEAQRLEKDIEHLNDKIASIKSVEELSSVFEINRKNKIKMFEEKLAELPSEEQLESYVDIIESHVEIISTIKKFQDIINDTSKQYEIAENDLASAEDKLKSLRSGKCYVCGSNHINENLIDNAKKDVDEAQKKVKDIQAELNKLDSKLDDLTVAETEIINEHKDILEMNIDDIVSNIDNMNKEIKRTQEEKNPYEDQLKTLDRDKLKNDVKSLEEKLSLVKESIKEIEDQTNKINDNFIAPDESKVQESLSLLKEHNIETIHDINRIEKDIDSVKERILELTNSINPFSEELKEVLTQFMDKETEESKLKDVEKKVTHIKYLIKLLTDSKSFIRKNIVDQYIPFLNKKINEYIDFLELPHVVEINSDLSSDIEYMQKKVSYYNMSQGERLRLNVSVSMAFRDLMSMLGSNTNLLMVDELWDSALDHNGRTKMFKFVQNNIDTLLMISHREEFQTMVDETITITKRNGFSLIE